MSSIGSLAAPCGREWEGWLIVSRIETFAAWRGKLSQNEVISSSCKRCWRCDQPGEG